MSADPGAEVKREEKEGKEEIKSYPYLSSLNPAQLKAVIHPPDIPLQILAGPGSGKTRVLTSRVAHLVRKHGYRPMEITAVTFTNKAANEMKKRLGVLLGQKDADALILGTFHATCAKYLRRYGQLIDLPNNFSITDADDCKKMMSALIKAKSNILETAHIQLKDTAVLSEISKAKAREETPDGMAMRAATDPGSSTNTLSFIAELYGEYEAALREANSLDFDDLLVFGLRLFRTAPRVISHCRHILVDEFQDTNTTQYELMRCFADANRGLTVVGDPDQSIYGWRSAEVENLNKMVKDFKGTEAIYLEENYRSTGSILAAAHSVVSQDRERIQKSLFTSHPKSTAVTLKTFSTPIIESSFIATEIKRMIAYSGGVLGYDDFAILLRYNALSRTIESTLQKDSIPNKIVGGHKFFERLEVKDLLAYLQLAENPGFNPAFIRAVNVPRRAIGDKSVADILAAARKEKIPPMELCERITDGDQLPLGLKPAVKKNLASFVGVIRKLRRAAQSGTSVADLLRMIIEKTGYEEHLRKTQSDFDSRWENVQELISYSVIVSEEQNRETNHEISEESFIPASAAMEAIANQTLKQEDRKKLHPMFRRTSTSTSTSTNGLDEEKPKKRRKVGGIKEEPIELVDSDDDLDGIVEIKPAGNRGEGSRSPEVVEEVKGSSLATDAASLNPLSYFLQTSMLSTDTESQEDEGKQPKVTITTVHSAKGLEWPVVFIPAVEQGTYPSYRCVEAHEVAEERRLLYVAMTRAQVFLSITHCNMRMLGGEDSQKDLSEFVSKSRKQDPTMLSSDLPDIDQNVRASIAGMLGRPLPDEVATKDAIFKHVRAAPPLSMWDAPEPQDRNFNRFARREITKATRAAEYWASDHDEYALPGTSIPTSINSGFQSARMGIPRPHHRDRDRDRERDREEPVSPAKPPPKPIKSRHVDIPAPLPFTFGKPDAEKSSAGLGSFTNANNNFLSNLDSLGVGPLGDDGESPFTSPALDGGGKLPATALPGRVELAKGKKRLGMGRPAPWGAKR